MSGRAERGEPDFHGLTGGQGAPAAALPHPPHQDLLRREPHLDGAPGGVGQTGPKVSPEGGSALAGDNDKSVVSGVAQVWILLSPGRSGQGRGARSQSSLHENRDLRER